MKERLGVISSEKLFVSACYIKLGTDAVQNNTVRRLDGGQI
jgi:hypothetical protein